MTTNEKCAPPGKKSTGKATLDEPRRMNKTLEDAVKEIGKLKEDPDIRLLPKIQKEVWEDFIRDRLRE